jgi:type VI secretion system protein ImpF
MAKAPRTDALLPSVLDRIVAPRGRGGLREIKESVRRDLEDLLNTRYRASAWPPDLEELEDSLVNYGIPDFTGSNLGSPESQDDFRRIIARVIEAHERRLSKVSVKLVRAEDQIDRVLRFRIEATLRLDPAPEQVVFDSSLEPISAHFQVKEGGR